MQCGKTAVEDAGLLAELGQAGWLAPPRWVPPPFRDRPGLLGRLEALEVRPDGGKIPVR
jgi:hypothetical protein